MWTMKKYESIGASEHHRGSTRHWPCGQWNKHESIRASEHRSIHKRGSTRQSAAGPHWTCSSMSPPSLGEQLSSFGVSYLGVTCMHAATVPGAALATAQGGCTAEEGAPGTAPGQPLVGRCRSEGSPRTDPAGGGRRAAVSILAATPGLGPSVDDGSPSSLGDGERPRRPLLVTEGPWMPLGLASSAR